MERSRKKDEIEKDGKEENEGWKRHKRTTVSTRPDFGPANFVVQRAHSASTLTRAARRGCAASAPRSGRTPLRHTRPRPSGRRHAARCTLGPGVCVCARKPSGRAATSRGLRQNEENKQVAYVRMNLTDVDRPAGATYFASARIDQTVRLDKK